MSRHPFVYLVSIVLLIGAVARNAAARQDAADEELAKEEIATALQELGVTVRAAVAAGVMTGAQAREIYGRVSKAEKASYARRFEGSEGMAGDSSSMRGDGSGLIVPEPEQVRILFQPEFLRRDLQKLHNELDLDHDQRMIAELLLAEYQQGYELAAAPLREGLRQYRSATMDAFIASLLEDADAHLEVALVSARLVDRAAALDRLDASLAQIDRNTEESLAAADEKGRREHEAWRQRMIDATGELDERLEAIRDRTSAQLAAMGETIAPISADELVRLAQQLRADRTQLRQDVVQSLEAITTASQRGEENHRFDLAMAQLDIARSITNGRLGGESMNVWIALRDSSTEQADHPSTDHAYESAAAMLATHSPVVAEKIVLRTEAGINREIGGIEFLARREQIAAANGVSAAQVNDSQFGDALRAYARDCRAELQASVALRDALLAALEQTATHLELVQPDGTLASTYRDKALRSGFPAETRPRWAERAVAAALRIDGLSEEVADALHAIETDVSAQLQMHRRQAIAARIQRDPPLVRKLIQIQFEGVAKDSLTFDEWGEVNFDAFELLDERTEQLLRGLLSADQYEALPPRFSKDEAAAKKREEKTGRR